MHEHEKLNYVEFPARDLAATRALVEGGALSLGRRAVSDDLDRKRR